MQVGSKISYEFNKNLSSPETQKTPSGISTPALLKNQKRDIYFGQETQLPQENKEQKKNPWSVKNVTNWGGVILGVMAITVPMILKLKRGTFEKNNAALEKIEAQAKAKIINTEDKISVLKGEAGNEGLWFNMIHKFGNWSKNNKELYNNIVYGVGTVGVMPLVIMFSPFGKKNSTKEDKLYAVLRQPLSFATMFSMQLTMDKLIGGLMPKFKKANILEKEGLFNLDGTIKDLKKIDEVKYNDEFLKGQLIEEIKQTLGKTEKEASKLAGSLLKLADENKEKPLDKIKELAVDQLKVDKESSLIKIFGHAAEVTGRGKVLGETAKILGNIFFSQLVGCTLLNVIYGKTMKKWGPKSPEEKQETAVKGGK